MNKLKYKTGDQLVCTKDFDNYKPLDIIKIVEVFENDLCCYRRQGKFGYSRTAEILIDRYFRKIETATELEEIRRMQLLAKEAVEEEYKKSHIPSENNEYVCIETMTNFLGESIKKGQRCHWALNKDKSGYDLLEYKGIGITREGLETHFKKVGK